MVLIETRRGEASHAPLVFIHGFSGGASSWRAVMQELATSRPTVAVTLPGHHGKHSLDAPSTFEDAVVGVYDALARAGVSGAHVVGYSLGARVALSMLVHESTMGRAANPSSASRLFSRATLIGVSVGLKSRLARDERATADAAWCALLREQGMAAFVDAWEQQPLFATQELHAPQGLRDAQRAVRLAHDAEALANAMQTFSLASMPDYCAQAGAIQVPVCLVTGVDDERFTRAAEEIAQLMQHATCRTLPNCGHNPLIENPVALATLF